MLKSKPSGPVPSRIMLVGEAPGANEEGKTPFLGSAGNELTKILSEAGIDRDECFLTNVSRYRPAANKIEHFFDDKLLRNPGAFIREGIRELQDEIRAVKPNVIVALGNTAFYALGNRPSGLAGISSWRGSELPLADRLATLAEPVGHRCVLIPAYHPAAILRQWSWRAITVHDFRTRVKPYLEGKALEEPTYEFITEPTFEQTRECLVQLLRRLSDGRDIRLAVDIETRHGHIACIGLAWSRLNSICIPLMCRRDPSGYWPARQETEIHGLLHQLLTHPRVRCVGQNFLYDAQYFAKHLGYVPRVRDDSMLAQHTCWPGVPKGLDFLSSMYCEFHRYWKEEGKEAWNPTSDEGERNGWIYNCKDAVTTFESMNELDTVIDKLGLREQYSFQMELWHHVLPMMLRGVRIDLKRRDELSRELLNEMMSREASMHFVLGHNLNPRSPKQMKALFYDDLGVSKQLSRKNRNEDGSFKVTLDEEALQAIARKEPLLRDFIRLIVEYRSLGVFLGTFVQARLGADGRMRCYFNPAGTETFRFSSSEDAFGSGTNLQNLPRGLEDETEIDISELVQYKLPNIRKLFIPDFGYTIGEVDLAGADAQVVAWEAEDPILKQIFREKRKLHVENGRMMYGAELMGVDGKREPYYTRIKRGVHASNYGATPPSLAKSLNIPVKEASEFQRRWFEIHPKLRDWQRRVDSELQQSRSVRNPFGYRRYYFDRVEEILPEGLAWVPQSTVACVANRALVYSAGLKELKFEMLLQVHDSLVFQYPTQNEALILPKLRELITMQIPYPDPLTIPWGLKTSNKSWGDAEERAWPQAQTLIQTIPLLVAQL